MTHSVHRHRDEHRVHRHQDEHRVQSQPYNFYVACSLISPRFPIVGSYHPPTLMMSDNLPCHEQVNRGATPHHAIPPNPPRSIDMDIGLIITHTTIRVHGYVGYGLLASPHPTSYPIGPSKHAASVHDLASPHTRENTMHDNPTTILTCARAMKRACVRACITIPVHHVSSPCVRQRDIRTIVVFAM